LSKQIKNMKADVLLGLQWGDEVYNGEMKERVKL